MTKSSCKEQEKKKSRFDRTNELHVRTEETGYMMSKSCGFVEAQMEIIEYLNLEE
jgi:hypothetical protein